MSEQTQQVQGQEGSGNKVEQNYKKAENSFKSSIANIQKVSDNVFVQEATTKGKVSRSMVVDLLNELQEERLVASRELVKTKLRSLMALYQKTDADIKKAEEEFMKAKTAVYESYNKESNALMSLLEREERANKETEKAINDALNTEPTNMDNGEQA